MSIMDLKKNAPKGEFLAYINKKEAAMLKKAGGSGKLVNGIPSFEPKSSRQAEQKSSTNQGPAGGASAGGNYGGNVNPTQTYAGKTPSQTPSNYGGTGPVYYGGNGPPSSTPKSPPKKPKPTKDNTVKKNPFEKYFSYNPTLNILDKITKNKFNTNINAKRREDYLNDLLDTDPDEYNRVMSDLADINMITGPTGIETQIGPDIRTDYGMPKGPPSQLTSNFEVIDGRKSLGDPAALEILGQKYKNTLQTFNGGGGDGNPYILPQYAMMGGGADMGSEDAVEEKTYDYRFGDDQDVIYENYGTPGYRNTRAEGGIMGTRARRAMGGIMNRVDQRQGYFLGSIVKGVKSAVGGVVDATKKVLKSDVGKMALLYGATAGLGSLAGGGGFSSLFKAGTYNPANFLGKQGYLATLGKKALLKGGTGDFTLGNLSLGKLGLLGLGGAALMGPAKQDDSIIGDRGGRLKDSQGNDALPADIRAEIRSAYASGDSDRIKNIQSYYNFLPGADAVKLPSVQPYLPYPNYAEGGRIGFNSGGSSIKLLDGTVVQIPSGAFGKQGLKDIIYSSSKGDLTKDEIVPLLVPAGASYSMGGRIGKAEGGLLDMGGMEKDYRAEGGFVPIGEYEKKDDVPARLSVNEFVFTADAVRGAGQGDIDKGAEIMENMMENLENGGTVSEESQGNKGAQQMFKTSERLGAVI